MIDGGLRGWLEQRRTASGLRVQRVSLADCAEWVLDRELRHRTGRYFQVVGVDVQSGSYAGWSQPMLRQTEIGILGFLARPAGAGHEWLLQAKTEPGNVGGTQIAPTVQATRSNYQRVHGGAPTRYLEWFLGEPEATVAADVVASEQGTRFLSKRNRNLVVTTSAAVAAGPSWRWVSSATLRSALRADFVVNTDARSVLVSAPWRLLSDETQPFGPADAEGFRGRLAASYATPRQADAATAQLQQAREHPSAVLERPLDDLAHWRVDEWGICSTDESAPSVIFVDVAAADREVPAWSQPLLAATTVTTCELWCCERDGVLQFLFRCSPEPGLTHGAELAPTVQSDLVQSPLPRPARAEVRLAAAQSDEGGRFYRTVCRYTVVEVGDLAQETPADGVWLTLGDIAALASRSAFTNEARSVISLLLSLA